MSNVALESTLKKKVLGENNTGNTVPQQGNRMHWWPFSLSRFGNTCKWGVNNPRKNITHEGLYFELVLAAVSLVRRGNGIWLLECFKPSCILPAVLRHCPPNMFAGETVQFFFVGNLFVKLPAQFCHVLQRR